MSKYEVFIQPYYLDRHLHMSTLKIDGKAVVDLDYYYYKETNMLKINGVFQYDSKGNFEFIYDVSGKSITKLYYLLNEIMKKHNITYNNVIWQSNEHIRDVLEEYFIE